MKALTRKNASRAPRRPTPLPRITRTAHVGQSITMEFAMTNPSVASAHMESRGAEIFRESKPYTENRLVSGRPYVGGQ